MNSLFTMTRTICAFAVATCLWALPLTARGFLSNLPTSFTSWEKGSITSRVTSSVEISEKGTPVDSHSGYPTSLNRARMEAYKHARESALERLATSIRSMRVDAESTVADVLEEHEDARGRLTEILTTAVKISERPSGFYSSTCEATIGFGDIISALPFEFPQREFPQRDDAKIRTDYTGLVIDGRGLPIVPMLFPSVFTERGLELYGRPFVSSAKARTGLVTYCRNEDEAMRHRKAGARPYYTVALRSLRGCPVIADRDARRILASPETTERLKSCNVIIIINTGKGENQEARAR